MLSENRGQCATDMTEVMINGLKSHTPSAAGTTLGIEIQNGMVKRESPATPRRWTKRSRELFGERIGSDTPIGSTDR
jgi:hypothetical protein